MSFRVGLSLFTVSILSVGSLAHAEEAKVDYSICEKWINQHVPFQGMIFMKDGELERPVESKAVKENGVYVITKVVREQAQPLKGGNSATVRLERKFEIRYDNVPGGLFRIRGDGMEIRFENVNGKCLPTDEVLAFAGQLKFVTSSRLCNRLRRFLNDNPGFALSCAGCDMSKIGRLTDILIQATAGYPENPTGHPTHPVLTEQGPLLAAGASLQACEALNMEDIYRNEELWKEDTGPAKAKTGSVTNQ